MDGSCVSPSTDVPGLLARSLAALRERDPARWAVLGEQQPSRKSRVFLFREPDGGRRAALRVYAEPRAAAQQAAALRHGAALDGRSGFTVPALIAEFTEDRALLVEWLDDLHLERVLVRAALAPRRHREAVRRSGAWLARFHALGGVSAGHFEAGRYRSLLAQRLAAAPLAAGRVAANRLWQRASAWLGPRLDGLDGRELPFALGHGDFTSTNILVGPARVTGIDLWAERRLPVAEDLARMVVYLAMGDPLPPSARLRPVPLAGWRAEQALLEGYGDFDRNDPAWETLVAVEALCRWLALEDRLARRESPTERWKRAGLQAVLTALLAAP